MTVSSSRSPAAGPCTGERGSRRRMSLSGVSVRYRVPRERISSFKHYAISWLQAPVVYESFCALDHVT
jgi:hypothetical protein